MTDPIKIETHSANGAWYLSAPYADERAAQKEMRRCQQPSSYTAWYLRVGDRRVGRWASVRTERGGHRRLFVPVDAAEEEARLAAIREHGPHPFAYGPYPYDGNRCITCGDVSQNTIHDGFHSLYVANPSDTCH